MFPYIYFKKETKKKKSHNLASFTSSPALYFENKQILQDHFWELEGVEMARTSRIKFVCSSLVQLEKG